MFILSYGRHYIMENVLSEKLSLFFKVFFKRRERKPSVVNRIVLFLYSHEILVSKVENKNHS
jgi:hypothetical protein